MWSFRLWDYISWPACALEPAAPLGGFEGSWPNHARDRSPDRNTSRASATAARSRFTANASRTSPRIRRSATRSGCWRACTTRCTTSARACCAPRPIPAAAATRTSSFEPRAMRRKWWARATRSPNGRASPTAGWAAVRITRRHFSPRSARIPDFYTPYEENARRWYKKVQEEVTFVNHAIVNPPVDRNKQLEEVRDVYMHVEKETDARPDRERREGGRHHFHADALQLHRQQRRAADQDQGFRLRLHRAHGRARREAVLPAVV